MKSRTIFAFLLISAVPESLAVRGQSNQDRQLGGEKDGKKVSSSKNGPYSFAEGVINDFVENTVLPSTGGEVCSDLVLHDDLDCTGINSMYCLHVTKSGAILDCGGHKIIGPGADLTSLDATTNGIFVSVDGVSIKNCILEGFDSCIRIKDPDGTQGMAPNCMFDDITGVTTIEASSMSNCIRGLSPDHASINLINVASFSNRFGIRPQTCSTINFEEVFACGNLNGDLTLNGATAARFTSESSGPITCDTGNGCASIDGVTPSSCGFFRDPAECPVAP